MARIAFLFPGQGAQHIGMGQQVASQYPAAAALFARASEILGYDLAEVCAKGPTEKLDLTAISQPAIFVTSLACLEKVKAEMPDLPGRCEMTAGLSLGEYTALVFAGAMTFEDGLRVVQQRGEAMQAAADATPSAMASILMIPPEQVQQICEQAAAEAGQVQIANYLCPGNLVVSGTKAGVNRAVELAEAANAKVVRLPVAGAFHTSIMKPADQKLAAALAGVTIQSPRIPVISNVDVASHADPAEIRDILVRQVLNPVRWEDDVKAMLAAGIDEFYEIGPGRVLTSLMKRINRKIPCTVINDTPTA
jgi:[acyl-carrier-protein] S-malonyltransferase